MTKRIHRKSVSTKKPYEVGFGKPPTATRFQPGRSGNPRGRPARRKSTRQLLQDALDAPILVTEEGVQHRIRKLDAFVKSLIAQALKGNSRSSSLLIGLLERHDLIKGPGDGIHRVLIKYVSAPGRPSSD